MHRPASLKYRSVCSGPLRCDPGGRYSARGSKLLAIVGRGDLQSRELLKGPEKAIVAHRLDRHQSSLKFLVDIVSIAGHALRLYGAWKVGVKAWGLYRHWKVCCLCVSRAVAPVDMPTQQIFPPLYRLCILTSLSLTGRHPTRLHRPACCAGIAAEQATCLGGAHSTNRASSHVPVGQGRGQRVHDLHDPRTQCCIPLWACGCMLGMCLSM
jgi:hypothetical protein